MIKKNASDKYVLTAEDAELLARFSVYAKHTLSYSDNRTSTAVVSSFM